MTEIPSCWHLILAAHLVVQSNSCLLASLSEAFLMQAACIISRRSIVLAMLCVPAKAPKAGLWLGGSRNIIGRIENFIKVPTYHISGMESIIETEQGVLIKHVMVFGTHRLTQYFLSLTYSLRQQHPLGCIEFIGMRQSLQSELQIKMDCIAAN